jgi:hypothetical protein
MAFDPSISRTPITTELKSSMRGRCYKSSAITRGMAGPSAFAGSSSPGLASWDDTSETSDSPASVVGGTKAWLDRKMGGNIPSPRGKVKTAKRFWGGGKT